MIKRKIPKEVRALANRFLPWERELNLRPPDGPPKGLRLSEPCGACCILDYFLDRKSLVNDGVSLEGHLKADIFFQSLVMPSARVEIEKVYQWAEKGFSGMDGIVEDDCPLQAHYELKTSSDQNPKPKRNNREQVIRQRVVMARYYGITDDKLFPSYIFIICKSGHKSNYVYGPFLIEATKEELESAARDIDLRIQVYDDIIEDGLEDDPHQHPLLKEMRRGSCTRCFPLQVAEPSEALLGVFSRGRDDWDDWTKHDKLSKWIKDKKEEVKPLVPKGEIVETPYFLVRHTESGRLYVDPRNLSG